MDVNDLKAKVFYYCRERHFHTMQEAALEGLKRFPGNAAFQLYNGLSLVLGSKLSEGLRELEALSREPDSVLAATLAMAWAHKRSGGADTEALATLDSRLKVERKRAGETALCHAARALLLLGKPGKAAEYADRAVKAQPDSVDGLTAKAWAALAGPRPLDAGPYVEAALKADRRDVDAAFAGARLAERGGDLEGGVVAMSALAARFPAFAAPLVEKMRLQLAARNWDAALDTAGRALAVDPSSLEPLRVKILSQLCREANTTEAALGLRRFFSEAERREPGDGAVLREAAVLFSRVCGGDVAVLAETYRLAERAARLDPADVDAACELGRQCLAQGRLKEAVRFYRGATKLDESSMAALVGLTMCQLQEAGFGAQARQQIEFLREVQGSSPSAEVLLMSAQLEAGNAEAALPLLDAAVSAHFAALDALPFGPKYLACLDPDMLLKVVDEYARYAPPPPPLTAGAPPPAAASTGRALAVLEAVTQALPASAPALLRLAELHVRRGDLGAAQRTLQHLVDDVDAASASAHLLMAQLAVRQGNLKRAEQCLERGVSFNFGVREQPLYHLISALIFKERGDLPRCIATLQTAIAQTEAAQTEDTAAQGLALADRASLYLELWAALRKAGQALEAGAVLETAGRLFGSTTEAGRLAIAAADHALERRDTQAALACLEAVKVGQPYFNQACCKMAEIHLKHRKDKRAFSECYREMVTASPDAATFELLGDAYVSIVEPELAIEAFQQALSRSPGDQTLRCKAGKAYVMCHQYAKAVAYYESACAAADCGVQLALDAAQLLLSIGRHAAAEAAIAGQLRRLDGAGPAAAVADRTRLLVLLAEVKHDAGDAAAALATLREARDNQLKVIKRAEITEDAEEQRAVAARICVAMAQRAEGLRDNPAAIRHYKEAMSLKAGDTDILVALAELYMQTNDLEQCQMSCMLLLNADPAHEPAMVMMADLAFRKIDFETAAFHFQQLLAKRPDYWTALARLVEVSRRMGKLSDATAYLSRAEAATAAPSQEAGLCYCRALHAWYGGGRNAALKLFNAARHDPEWGQQAVYNMVKICLSSEDDMLGFVADDDEATGAREMTVRMAEQLLKELKPMAAGGRDQALGRRLLGNFLLLAAGAKASADRVLADLTALAAQEAYQDHAGVAYAIAVTYMVLKQTPRARNQLKRVAKYRWNFEDADYLESCWLLLAELYVQAGKLELAGELVKRVLQHNRGSSKALEFAALIAEKEQGPREAALLYDQAWRAGGCGNPGIGFKLAFNHLKSKRYADAIDVCQRVLKDYPDYPRIRKDILDKARNNLKT